MLLHSRLRSGATVALALLVALTGGCASAVPGVSGPASTPSTASVPSSAGSPSAAPPAGPAVTGVGTAGGGELPPDLLLPNEGERSAVSEFSDWTTNNAPGQAWLLDPCRPTAYPTDAQRVGFRTVSRTGPEAADARQLAQYPTPEIAAEVMAGFRRALAACSTGGQPADGTGWQWVTAEAPDLGDEGLLAASTVGGPGFSPTGDRVAVTRVGSAVFLAFGSGEYSTAALDGGAADARAVAQTFIDSL
jgi:hypothetical protein